MNKKASEARQLAEAKERRRREHEEKRKKENIDVWLSAREESGVGGRVVGWLPKL